MGWKRPRHGPSQVLGLVVYKHRPTWNPLHRGRSSLETYQLQALGHKATCQILRYKRAVGVGVTTRSPGEDCPHSQIHQWDLSHGCYRFPSWISGTLLFLFHQLEDTFTSLTSRMLSVVDTARLGKKKYKMMNCMCRISSYLLVQSEFACSEGPLRNFTTSQQNNQLARSISILVLLSALLGLNFSLSIIHPSCPIPAYNNLLGKFLADQARKMVLTPCSPAHPAV